MMVVINFVLFYINFPILATGLGFVCFFVIKSCVLADRVDLGLFCFIKFSNFTLPQTLTSLAESTDQSVQALALLAIADILLHYRNLSSSASTKKPSPALPPDFESVCCTPPPSYSRTPTDKLSHIHTHRNSYSHMYMYRHAH